MRVARLIIGADGMVTIDELIVGTTIVLGDAALDRCASLDVNGDGIVTINETILAVTQALDGCPASAILTPIETASALVSCQRSAIGSAISCGL